MNRIFLILIQWITKMEHTLHFFHKYSIIIIPMMSEIALPYFWFTKISRLTVEDNAVLKYLYKLISILLITVLYFRFDKI
jgi:hypothetical protein